MTASLRFTSADLELMPDNGKRYEIIDGELYVSKQPGWHHQRACGRVFRYLDTWNDQAAAGEVAFAPGVIFAEDDDVAPDVAWVSKERLPLLMDDAGHLRGAPDLVVEVLSPGPRNEQRDRDVKLRLYSRRGVREYWILDWQQRRVEVYRRREAALYLAATLHADDALTSPLLPGFTCSVADLFG